MASYTEADYEAAIPQCCSQRTMQQHLEMMLCWSLAASLRDGTTMDCSGCDLRMPGVPQSTSTGEQS